MKEQKKQEKRVFLVAEKGSYDEPEGVYFTGFLYEADEMWVLKGRKQENEGPYVLAARCLRIPIKEYWMDDGKPTVSPKRERTQEKAYEL